MIEVIFTIDYEIYGNGTGALKDLVYDPMCRLSEIFDETGKKIVSFTEAAEFEMIAANASDSYIDKVQDQIRQLHQGGHEIALHLHPQWYGAEYKNGKWELDYSEYNLCNLPKERIDRIVSRSIDYLRNVIDDPEFLPFSFRAGNWLFQPTQTVSTILSDFGILVDSSVFKGGLQHKHGLDYRPSLKNGYYWNFVSDVNLPENNGKLLEVPIYTRMVPFWKMATAKRISLQQKSKSSGASSFKDEAYRLFDRMRLHYPLKFDFCRMTFGELKEFFDHVLYEDNKSPSIFKPIVLIGHSKDLFDFDTIKSFLEYLLENDIAISTYRDIHSKCI